MDVKLLSKFPTDDELHQPEPCVFSETENANQKYLSGLLGCPSAHLTEEMTGAEGNHRLVSNESCSGGSRP